ncbi:phosphoribosyltransferase [Candidatus Bathyarchaeota archaeon]|nr:phosphoribosyltransferase [Candidatus Bathyarchaeota archaeon]
MEFEIPTWDKIYEFLLSLAEKIREDDFKPDVIVGVSRGGWLPARVMSDLLENPEIANVKAEFYLGVAQTKGEPLITQPVSVSVMDKEVLLMDDVADTGKSLRLVKSHLKEKGATEVKIATIYYKPWSVVIPDYYEKETTSWIIFPWERKETIRNIIKRYKKEGKSVEDAKDKLVSSGLDSKLVERFVREILEGQA